MNLLRQPEEIWEFLLRLGDPKEIRKYSKRRLRKDPLNLILNTKHVKERKKK